MVGRRKGYGMMVEGSGSLAVVLCRGCSDSGRVLGGLSGEQLGYCGGSRDCGR